MLQTVQNYLKERENKQILCFKLRNAKKTSAADVVRLQRGDSAEQEEQERSTDPL